MLEPVTKEEVEHRLSPRAQREFGDLRKGPSCYRNPWKGSHHHRLATLVKAVWRAGAAP